MIAEDVQLFCSFYKHGHCRKKSKCGLSHNIETCPHGRRCNQRSTCIGRHPPDCINGSHCPYKHCSHMHPSVDTETVLMTMDGEERNEIKTVLEPPSCRHNDVFIEEALEKLELQNRVIEKMLIEKEVLGKELKQISENVLQQQLGFEKEIEVLKNKIEDYFVDKKEKFEDDMTTPFVEAVKEINDTFTEKSDKVEYELSVANEARKEIENSIIKLEGKVKKEQQEMYERIKRERENETDMVMSIINNQFL